MPAIITDNLRDLLVDCLVQDIQDSANNYFIAIGRSEDWDSADATPTPVNSQREIRQLQSSLQSMIVTGDYSYTVPRYNWSAGTIYSAFDYDAVGATTPTYYVVNDNNQVFMCLRQGQNISGQPVVSTEQPTSASTVPVQTADGYVWKFLYSISAKKASDFLAANFMPVQLVGEVDSASSSSEIEQQGIQNAAIPGQINIIKVTDPGNGYSSTPTVTIIGDGVGAEAQAFVNNGVVTKIEIVDSAGTFKMGQNYTYANVVLSGGGVSDSDNAAAQVSISPVAGFGADPRADLRSTALMFNAKPSGNLNDDFIVDNDFRQVAIVRNPKKDQDIDSDFVGASGICLQHLPFSSVTVPFTPDKTIEGANSTARAWVDAVDSSNVYFHQNEQTGFLSFEEGELVTELDGNGSGNLVASGVDGDSDAFVRADIDKYSGDVLYIDSRAAVLRSAEQTEDIKVIIKV